MKILSMPAGGSTNLGRIVVDGNLNSAYSILGDYVQEVGDILIRRETVDGQNGAQIVGVDFTDLSTITFDYEKTSGSSSVFFECKVNTLYVRSYANNTRLSQSIDVSGITGVHNIEFTLYGNVGRGKIYNIIAS